MAPVVHVMLSDTCRVPVTVRSDVGSEEQSTRSTYK